MTFQEISIIFHSFCHTSHVFSRSLATRWMRDIQVNEGSPQFPGKQSRNKLRCKWVYLSVNGILRHRPAIARIHIVIHNVFSVRWVGQNNFRREFFIGRQNHTAPRVPWIPIVILFLFLLWNGCCETAFQHASFVFGSNDKNANANRTKCGSVVLSSFVCLPSKLMPWIWAKQKL